MLYFNIIGRLLEVRVILLILIGFKYLYLNLLFRNLFKRFRVILCFGLFIKLVVLFYISLFLSFGGKYLFIFFK